MIPSLHAQNASISGQVIDPSGALVKGVQVTLTNDLTNTTLKAKTNGVGIYSLPFVAPGKYTLRAEATGFSPYTQTGIIVTTAQNLELDLRIRIGGAEQSITVDGSGGQINTTDATVSTVIDRQFVENMPLNGRSFQSLIALVPGVNVVPVLRSGASYSGEYSVNGQRTESNYFTVDGVSSNTGTGGGNTGDGAGYSGSTPSLTLLGTTQSIVSIDALQEFRATTSTFSAEYGRTPGGQFSFQTRSGTNDWHGTAFNYFRNEALDANNYFNNWFGTPRQAERQNDFGGTLAGPLHIPLLYNGRDKTFFFFSYEGLRLKVPSPAQQYTVPTVALRQQVPDALKPFMNAFPLPNGDDMGDGMAYFLGSYSAPSGLDSTSIRVDHQLTDKFRIFGRYSYVPSSTKDRSSGDLAETSSSTASVSSITLGSTNTFSESLSNEARFNTTWNNSNVGTSSFDGLGGATPFQLNTVPGFADPTRSQFELVVFYDAASPFIGSLPNRFRQQSINATDSLSLLIGRHSLKFGADYRHIGNKTLNAPFTLFGEFTSQQDLLNDSTTVRVLEKAAFDAARPIYNQLSVFAQDEWKATKRLNLSLGLRWDLAPPPHDADGHNPYTITTTNLSSMLLASANTPLWRTTYGNFAPRFGAAYQVHQRPNFETVIRGGVGLFYDAGVATATQGYSSGVGSVGMLTQFGVGFPATEAEINSVPAPSATAPYSASIWASDPHLKLPYSLEWNVSLEQAMGAKRSLTLSYVGTVGRRLYLQKQYYPDPIVNPNFSSGNGVYLTTNGAQSNYNALQVQFQHRLSHGLQALLSTTWAHAFDDATSNFEVLSSKEWGPSDNDIRLNFQGAVTYDLPGTFQNHWLSTMASHWSLDTRISARSALPVDIWGSYTVDPVTQSNVDFHPNRIPGVPLYIYDSKAPGGRIINCEAFIENCDPSNLPQGEGNAGRNSARGFDAIQTDLALRKEFHLSERLQMQFRVEAFNLFNHPILGSIDNELTDGPPNTSAIYGFGLAEQTLNSALGGLNSLYQVGGPRSLQLALKLHF